MQFQGDEELRKGTWLEEEDERLITFVKLMGERRWDALARASGLKRSGKSCRLRWLNYLRPNLKHGHISVEEEHVILQLQERWGNKWSKIARRLPGRTDNEIKNYWRTHLRKKTQFQEGYSQYHLENTKQDSFQNGDTDARNNYNYENQGSVCDDLGGLTDQDTNSTDAIELSAEFALTSSPYETRLSDWINTKISYQDECNSSFESGFSFPNWTPDDSLSWDCSGFLWDI
ncbi:hypothetical protein FNV43_RR15717 [Rhamnella rubrinervis]|uniref:Uncharacterized protein n=1 Tax=Rhamnella rubrinervis TaxID=2594499 RepID=A0A8K0ED40_9ROSA|nr:hypothetical protein FNV43_RR15717 [Rhamnella rubrinervis]